MQPNQTDRLGWQFFSFIYYVRSEGVETALKKTYIHLRSILPLLPRKSSLVNFVRFRRIGVLTACDIQTALPRSTTLGHATGIVIGPGTDIGEEVQIRQNVTIGKDDGEEDPTIEDKVSIGAGAVILNGITVGKNTTIGANATVISDIPPNSVAVGSPAEVVKRKEETDTE